MIDYIINSEMHIVILIMMFIFSCVKIAYYTIIRYIDRQMLILRVTQEELLDELIIHEQLNESLKDAIQDADYILSTIEEVAVVRDDDGNVIDDSALSDAIGSWREYNEELLNVKTNITKGSKNKS